MGYEFIEDAVRRVNSPEALECNCGHTLVQHDNEGPCFGTGADLDPIYGIPADEPCACTAFDEMESLP